MRIKTRRKWWFWEMRVALSCGRVWVCGPRRPLLRPRRGGWRACPRATGLGRVARGAWPWPGGAEGRSRRQRWGREARGCGLCLVLGWAGVLQCVRVCGLVSAGGNSSRGLHFGGRGALAWGSRGVSGGVCGSLGVVGVPWGVRLVALGVWRLSGVGGGEGCLAGGSVAGVCGYLVGLGRPVSRGPGLCVMVGLCGSPGGERGGRGRGGDCVGGGGCCVGVCVCLQRRACVVSCRLDGSEESLAVFWGRSKDFADERAYLVHLSVSGGKRVF